MVVHQAFVTKLTEVVHVTMGLLATDANYRVLKTAKDVLRSVNAQHACMVTGENNAAIATLTAMAHVIIRRDIVHVRNGILVVIQGKQSVKTVRKTVKTCLVIQIPETVRMDVPLVTGA